MGKELTPDERLELIENRKLVRELFRYKQVYETITNGLAELIHIHNDSINDLKDRLTKLENKQ